MRLGLGSAGLLFGSSLLAACGSDDEGGSSGAGDDGELDALRVALGWINNVEFGGIWIGLAEGLYTEAGIDPTFLQGGPNAPAPPVAVAAGDADIGQDPSMRRVVDAILEGNDFVMFGTQFQTSPAGVLSLAERPILTPEDLVGSTFLGQEGVDITIDAVLDVAGLPKDYSFVPAGFTPDPLLEGQGDAYSCFLTNQPLVLEEQGLVQGEDFFVTSWDDLGLPAYANVLFAERSYLEENHDLLVRFMRALIGGWEINEDDPAVAATLAVEEYGADLGLDINQQTRENEVQIPMHRGPLTEEKGLFWLDVELLGGPMYDALEASGRTGLPDAESIVDLTILEDAYDGKTSIT